MNPEARFIAAKNALFERFKELDDIAGIGESTVNGDRCLVVYFDSESSMSTVQDLPLEFRGIPVIKRFITDQRLHA